MRKHQGQPGSGNGSTLPRDSSPAQPGAHQTSHRAQERTNQGSHAHRKGLRHQEHEQNNSAREVLGLPPELFALLRGILRPVWVTVAMMLGLLTVVLVASRRGALERKFKFDDIAVPAAFQDGGYTGSYLSKAMMDEMYAIRDAAGVLDPMREIRGVKEERDLPPLNIEVQGQTISLTAISEALFPRPDSTVIVTGQLARADTMGELVIRVGTKSKRLPFSARFPTVPGYVIRDAAEFVLQEAEPYVLAFYLAGRDSSRARRLLNNMGRSKQPRLRAQALTGLAVLASRTSDATTKEEQLLLLSISADSSYPGGYIDLAAVYNWRRRNAEALLLLDSTPPGENSWNALAAANRAGVFNDLGRYEEGLESARKAVALEDGFISRYNAAKALFGLRRFADAEVQLDHALTFEPNNPHVRWNKAMALAVQGDTAEARIMNEQIQKETPSLLLNTRLLDALLNGLDSVVNVSRSTAAVDSMATAMADRLSILGEWLSLVSRHSDAQLLLEQAAKLDPITPIVQWRIARGACMRGDSLEAAKRFKRFIELDERRNGAPRVHASPTLCTPGRPD